MAISARQLAKLIGVAERSIHRAEQTGNLGVKISLAMELLLTRLQHGEIDLPSSLDAPPRMGRPPKRETEPGSGGTWGRVCRRVAWEDEHRRGYTPLATVSGAMAKGFSGASRCACETLNRAEGSESPSPGLIYGVELLRKQILQKEFDLDEFRKSRDRTLPRKKKK